MEAEIVIRYDDVEMAEAVASAVSPDNFKVPRGLNVKTIRRNNEVLAMIKCNRGFPSFIATIDDLLFCISVAERTVRTIK
ncbi:MAG: KEOPS complex subunit Pcc1 [Candidatus Bathyarchaeia archaeon]